MTFNISYLFFLKLQIFNRQINKLELLAKRLALKNKTHKTTFNKLFKPLLNMYIYQNKYKN